MPAAGLSKSTATGVDDEVKAKCCGCVKHVRSGTQHAQVWQVSGLRPGSTRHCNMACTKSRGLAKERLKQLALFRLVDTMNAHLYTIKDDNEKFREICKYFRLWYSPNPKYQYVGKS